MSSFTLVLSTFGLSIEISGLSFIFGDLSFRGPYRSQISQLHSMNKTKLYKQSALVTYKIHYSFKNRSSIQSR